MDGRTILVGNRRGGIAHVALLEDALGGGSMGRLHLIAVVAPLCAQLLSQSLVAHQISLRGLQAHRPGQLFVRPIIMKGMGDHDSRTRMMGH